MPNTVVQIQYTFCMFFFIEAVIDVWLVWLATFNNINRTKKRQPHIYYTSITVLRQ